MSLQFNGAKAQVSFDTTALNKTAAIAEGTINGAGSVTVGTVPTGKVWRIVGIWMTGCINNGGTVPQLLLNSVIAMELKFQASATTYTPLFGSIKWEYSACPVLAAAQTVVITNPGAGMQTYGGVSYVEESA